MARTLDVPGAHYHVWLLGAGTKHELRKIDTYKAALEAVAGHKAGTGHTATLLACHEEGCRFGEPEPEDGKVTIHTPTASRAQRRRS